MLNGKEVPSVALVTGSLSPLAGGLYFSARLPANLMAERGRAPAVIGLMDDQWGKARQNWTAENVDIVPRRGPAAFGSTQIMLDRLARVSPDLVHLRGIWGPYSAAAWWWRRRTGRPLIISTHGMVDKGALGISKWKKRIVGGLYEYANLRGATALHALNTAEHQRMRSLGCLGPIAIIPNGVDIEPLAQPDSRRGRVKHSLLFLSRLHAKKGVEELLRAWKIARKSTQSLRNWTLTIAGWGDGDYVAKMMKCAASLDVTDSVDFPGALFGEEKRCAFEAADAFVLPSFSEGLPVAVLEAWERGLPVLMTDACNLPEGFVAKAALRTTNDPETLAQSIVQLCSLSDVERVAMGARGRALVAEHYDWERITDQYLSLYDWVAGRNELPAFVDIGDRPCL